MRITDHLPFRSVSHDQYAEEFKYPLPLENISANEIYIARFLRGAIRQRGDDYFVRIGEIAIKPKRRLWTPRLFQVYPLVSLQPVNPDGESQSELYDQREVNGRGLIYGKGPLRDVAGYFVQESNETDRLDDVDLDLIKLINDPGSLPDYRPPLRTKS